LGGRRCPRRWPAARPRRWSRFSSCSGAMRGIAKPYVHVGAQVGAREELCVVCGSRARAEEGVHRRWQQWRMAVAWRGDSSHKGKERRVFIDRANRGEAVRVHVGTGSRHGRRGYVDVRWSSGQWWSARASAGKCAEAAWHRPRGWRTSPPLGAQCPRRTASDRWVFRWLGVRACPYGGEAVEAQHAATSHVTRAPA
jgi:hypothetical protein